MPHHTDNNDGHKATNNLTVSHIEKKKLFINDVTDNVVKVFNSYHDLTVTKTEIPDSGLQRVEFMSTTLATAYLEGSIVKGKSLHNYTYISVQISRLYIDLSRLETNFSTHVINGDVNSAMYSSLFMLSTLPAILGVSQVTPTLELVKALISYEIENLQNDAILLLADVEGSNSQGGKDSKSLNKDNLAEITAKSLFCLATIGSLLYAGHSLIFK